MRTVVGITCALALTVGFVAGPATMAAADPIIGSIDALTIDAGANAGLPDAAYDSSDSDVTVTTSNTGLMTATHTDGTTTDSASIQIPVVPGPGGYAVGDPNSTPPIALGLATKVGNTTTGCSTETGTLTVAEAEYIGQEPELFTASYAISCDGGPTIYGDIRWQSTQFYRAIVPSTPSVSGAVAAVGDSVLGASIYVESVGDEATHTGTVTITGPDAGDWQIEENGCTNATLNPGSDCYIAITFAPSDVGDRTATLTVSTNTDRGSVVIPLDGVGAVVPDAPPTTVDVAVHRAEVDWSPPANDGGTPITSYQVYRTAPGQSATLVDTVTPQGSDVGGAYADSGLATGATYKYAVYAVNAIGPGPDAVVNATIPRDELLLDASTAVTTDGGEPVTVGHPLIQGRVAVVPGDDRIIYPAKFNPDNVDLVSAAADGSGLARRLTTTGATDPAVSLDGSTIAFVHVDSSGAPSIWTMPVNGGTPVEVAANLTNPSWLPDGRSLVAEVSTDVNTPTTGAELVTVAPDGTTTPIPGTTNGHQPAVSPDGKWIAFQYLDPGTGDYALDTVPVAGGTAKSTTAAGSASIDDISWRTDSQQLFAAHNGKVIAASFSPGSGPGPLSTITASDVSGVQWPAYVNTDAVSLGATPAGVHANPSTPVNTVAGSTSTCSLDGGTSTSCQTEWNSPAALTPGQHTLVVTSTPADGIASTVIWTFTVDYTAPTVTVHSPSALSTPSPVTISYTGHDAVGVASYDVRYRDASIHGGYGKYHLPTIWQATTQTSLTKSVEGGHEYCFSVRSRDIAGNVSKWSPDHCTAIPLDDRALSASAGWSREHGAAYLHHTLTTSSTKGATLTLGSVSARRVIVYAAKCHNCGTIAVAIGGKRIATLRLHGNGQQQIRAIATHRLSKARTGTLTLTVKTNHKPVRIDAVAIRH